MGSHMAAVLVASGCQLVVCDTNDAATQSAVALGASVASSPAALAANTGAEYCKYSKY